MNQDKKTLIYTDKQKELVLKLYKIAMADLDIKDPKVISSFINKNVKIPQKTLVDKSTVTQIIADYDIEVLTKLNMEDEKDPIEGDFDDE